MKTMKFRSEEISEFQKLARGACSTVYRYDNNFCIKVFNEKGLKLHDEESFSALVEVKNETCVFPESLVEVDGNIQGYVMQYIEGTEFQNVAKELDFRKIIEAIQKVEKDLKTLASYKILFNDLNQGGIMWSNEGKIKIIDPDFFYKNKDKTKEQAYSHNLESFNLMIEMELGILNAQPNTVADFLHSNTEYKQLYKDYLRSSVRGNTMSVIELLNKAMEIFKHEFGVVPGNISEMETILKEKNLIIHEEVEPEKPIFKPPLINKVIFISEEDLDGVPVEKKEEAGRQVQRDEQELEPDKKEELKIDK